MGDFQQRFVVLDVGDNIKLPFSIGGVTQQGSSHYLDGFNNQDAMSLALDAACIVGVVCDGCSSGSDIMAINPWSFAESGAQILTSILLRRVREAMPDMDFERLAKNLSEQCLADINMFLGLLSGHDAALREHLLRQLFMATILIFIVTEERYCVMNCGDGLVAINGQFFNLNQAFSGQYLANSLSTAALEPLPEIKVFSQGNTEDLQNLLIATDGVSDVLRNGKGVLEEMLGKTDARNYALGLDRIAFLREFRKRVANAFEPLSPRSHDDRSLLMLRRINTQGQAISI